MPTQTSNHWLDAKTVYQATAKNKWLPVDEFIKRARHLWHEQYEAVTSTLADSVGQELGEGRCRLIWPDGEPLFVQCVEPLAVDEEEGLDEYSYEERLCDPRFEADFVNFIAIQYGYEPWMAAATIHEHDRYLKRGELLMRLLIDANLGDFPPFDEEHARTWHAGESILPTGVKDGTLSLFG